MASNLLTDSFQLQRSVIALTCCL